MVQRLEEPHSCRRDGSTAGQVSAHSSPQHDEQSGELFQRTPHVSTTRCSRGHGLLVHRREGHDAGHSAAASASPAATSVSCVFGAARAVVVQGLGGAKMRRTWNPFRADGSGEILRRQAGFQMRRGVGLPRSQRHLRSKR